MFFIHTLTKRMLIQIHKTVTSNLYLLTFLNY